MNSRHPDRISPNSSPNTASNPSLLYGGIDTVKGTAIGAITYEFNGPGWHVDEFLRELAANSDVIDFGTAAKPVATPTQSPDMPPTPKTAPMTHWRPILPPRRRVRRRT